MKPPFEKAPVVDLPTETNAILTLGKVIEALNLRELTSVGNRDHRGHDRVRDTDSRVSFEPSCFWNNDHRGAVRRVSPLLITPDQCSTLVPNWSVKRWLSRELLLTVEKTIVRHVV